MAQTDAETAVLQAMHDGALTPYGSAKVQMQNKTGYVAVPINLVDHFGLQQGHGVQRAYHAETGCLMIFLRPDYDPFAQN